MAATFRDIDDAILTGKARYAEFAQEFRRNFYAPAQKNALAVYWHTLDPRLKEIVRLNNPEKYAELEQLYGGD
jgi:hypothetical protein